jgi:hypothetical protein
MNSWFEETNARLADRTVDALGGPSLGQSASPNSEKLIANGSLHQQEKVLLQIAMHSEHVEVPLLPLRNFRAQSGSLTSYSPAYFGPARSHKQLRRSLEL